MSPGADPNHGRGGVGDVVQSPAWARSSQPNAGGPDARRGGVEGSSLRILF